MSLSKLRVHEASGHHMATLEHAAAMIQAAEKGLEDVTLEKQAETLFPGEEDRRVFDYFRDYAWRCAATGIPRERLIDSIAMHEGPSDAPSGGMPAEDDADGGVPALAPEGGWLQAAEDIREQSTGKKHGPAVHPYFQGVRGPSHGIVREGVTLTVAQQALILSYYESYLFGATLRSVQLDDAAEFKPDPGYRARVAARRANWEGLLAQVHSQAAALLGAHADAVRLHVYLSKYDADVALQERWDHACAYSGYDWVSALRDAESGGKPQAAGPFWKTFKARIKPLAESLKGSGKLSKLLAERLAAHKLARERAAVMLDTLGRLEVTLANAEVDLSVHALSHEHGTVTLQPTANAGEVKVTLGADRTPGAPQSVTLRFVRASPAPASADGPSGTPVHTRYAAAQPGASAFEVELPASRPYLERMSKLSPAFAALGETVNLAIAVTTLCDAQARSKDKLTATFDLTKGVVAIVKDLPSALAVLQPELADTPLLKGANNASKRVKDVSTWLGRVDHVSKVYKGLDILFSPDTQVQHELRMGRPFRADVQRFNDVANVVVGAASAVELVGTAAAAMGVSEILGCSTTLVAGFSATPVGLMMAVGGGLVVAGSALVLDASEPWEKRLMAVEAALAQACKEECRGKRLRASVRLDALLGALEFARESWDVQVV